MQTPYGVLQFVPNKYYDAKHTANSKLYFVLINPKNLAGGMLSSLQAVASSKLSSVINLSYRDEVPQRAEDILNQLLESYDLASVNEKDKLASNTLAFVNETS